MFVNHYMIFLYNTKTFEYYVVHICCSHYHIDKLAINIDVFNLKYLIIMMMFYHYHVHFIIMLVKYLVFDFF